jgi:hypothetical protein
MFVFLRASSRGPSGSPPGSSETPSYPRGATGARRTLSRPRAPSGPIIRPGSDTTSRTHRELRSGLPEDIRLKEAELASEERRLSNFLDFIGEGRGSRALGKVLIETERRAEALKEEIEDLRASRERVFSAPPIEWIRERLGKLQEVLEQNTARSALLLRQFLGPIRLEPVQADIGRPYFRAVTAIDALALVEAPPDDPEGAKGRSNSLHSWR